MSSPPVSAARDLGEYEKEKQEEVKHNGHMAAQMSARETRETQQEIATLQEKLEHGRVAKTLPHNVHDELLEEFSQWQSELLEREESRKVKRRNQEVESVRVQTEINDKLQEEVSQLKSELLERNDVSLEAKRQSY